MARPSEMNLSINFADDMCIGAPTESGARRCAQRAIGNRECDTVSERDEDEDDVDDDNNNNDGDDDDGEKEEDYSVPDSPERELRRPLRSCRVGFAEMEAGENSIRKDINKDLNKLSRKGTGSVRYTQPRLSLLGKPINYKLHKRDLRYRRIQSKIYNFLERPKYWYAFLYHLLVFLVCVGSLVLSTLSTIDAFEPMMSTSVMILEPIILLWLMVEYVSRIWSSGCRSRYQGWSGRFRFAQRPLCVVDFVILVASTLVMLVGSATQKFAASTLRGLRFFQILRMVRVDRRAGTWKLLASVVWAHRQELLTTLYIGFLGLLFSSFLVYLAEKDYHPERFGTFADALWWGVVTLCTVGYGDVVPSTWAGKFIAAFSAVLGISFFALPAGILGSGFALKVQQQQRQKHLIRRRVPAALLIQSLWRCYAADENSMSIATWKPHMIPCPSPPQDRPFKNNTSFVSRFSTKRKDRGSTAGSGNNSPHSPLIPRRESKKNGGNTSEEEIPETLHRSHLSLATGLVDARVDRIAVRKESSVTSFGSNHQSEEDYDSSPKVRDLTDVHKRAIRALRKIKYFVARRKFREALRPYDVKDVIEQYSAGHVDMLGRVKSLQCRIDQILGKAGSKNKDVYNSNVSLSSRIVKVERQVEDIETKLDILIDLYKEDRKILLQQCKPSNEAVLESSDKTSQKPRSILIDKQYTSEPSSPIVRHPKKLMQRNHSDLSSRIRKRVTYRLHSSPAGNLQPSSHLENSFIPENTIPRSLSESYTRRPPSSECPDERTCSNEFHKAVHSNNRSPSPENTSNCSGTDSDSNNQTQPQSKRRSVSPTCQQTVSPTITQTDSEPMQYLPQSGSQTALADVSFCDPMTPESPIDVEKEFAAQYPREECTKIDMPQDKTIPPARTYLENDHIVLLPRGSMQALSADTSDV